MTSPILRLLVAACLMAVTACGTESQSPTAQAFQGVKSLFDFSPKAPPPGPDELLTRDVIDQVTVPYAMVGIERRGAYASMTLAGQNQAYESWVTSDGAGIVLRNGLVTGTKGLGADLLTADLGGMDQLVQQSSGSANRIHRFLDGEGRVFALTYTCTAAPAPDEQITIIGRSYSTRVVVETCSAPDQEPFENRYWIGKSDGNMWQSRQWVSAIVGHVVVLSLVPVAR